MAPKHRLYTPEIAETILERLADGESLRDICDLEGMPSRGAVQHWVINDHEGFAIRFARAREVALGVMEDDLIAVSDDGRNDTYTDGEGNKRTNQDVVQRSRLRVDTRKWILSKRLPKVFGDRIDLNHSGELAMKEAPDDQLQSRILDLLGKAGIAGPVGGTGVPPDEAET